MGLFYILHPYNMLNNVFDIERSPGKGLYTFLFCIVKYKVNVPRLYLDSSNWLARSIDSFRAIRHGTELILRGYKLVTNSQFH